MRTPTWLAAELETLNTRRLNGDITRSDAITLAVETAEAKDPDLMAEIHYEWFGHRLDESAKRMATRAGNELDKRRNEAATGQSQPGFDEVCSYFFPPDTWPDSSLLTAACGHAYDLLGRAERHHSVAKERVKFAERMVDAVGGNADGKATIGDGKAALQVRGDEAAADG